MAVTIYDIAREAEVSIATVSRVFNKNPNVSVKAREKVLKIAKAMGYHPQAMAQGLARKKTKLITAIVPVLSNYFFTEVLDGIQDGMIDVDYDLNIYNVRTTDDIPGQVDYLLKRGMAEGYLIISVHLPEKKWKQFRNYQLPIVLIDEYSSEFDSVSVDSIEGAYNATEYLIKSDYQRIAMITAYHEAKPAQDRILGYRRALEDNSRIVDETLIFSGDDMDRDGFTERNGYEAMLKLLKTDLLPDACFCNSDIQALGAIKAMQDANTFIPLIGFDDIRFSELLGLTTMKQPMYDMGKLAIEKLLCRLNTPGSDVSHTVFSPEMIIRSSSSIDIHQEETGM
ncbi:MAG: LacI family transcriptional regulator [Balneolaceae bacterium]|nr:MAG: LacI family transcriptional regulator [Balneolaceae bacterium]